MKLRTRVVDGKVVAGDAAVRAHPRGRAHDRVRRVAAERDGWICQICGEPIDPALRRPDPMALATHHHQELAAGGSDEMRNLQTAHADCNLRRRTQGGRVIRAGVVPPR